MKKSIFSLLFIAAIFVSCEEDNDEPVVPIVNINEESKGDPISFGIPNGSFLFNPLDSFTVIKGGVPPYLVSATDNIGSAYINNDTLFFSLFTAMTPTICKITVEDSRGYNQSQLNFVNSPISLTYNVGTMQFPLSFSMLGVDDLGDSSYFPMTYVELEYNIKEDSFELFASTSYSSDKLSFSYSPTEADKIKKLEFRDVGFSFTSNQVNPRYSGLLFIEDGTSSSVSLTKGYLGIPTNLSFNINVKDGFTGNVKLNLKADNLILSL
ncbi:MAG: hypothetical protein RIC95_10195 [Vicingaceae bacterium]